MKIFKTLYKVSIYFFVIQLIGGFSFSFLIKDASAYIVFQKTISEYTVNYDGGYSILATSDDGYVITGSTYVYGAGNSDLFLIKFDSSGNLSWAKTVGGASYDDGYCVYQTSDGGYIVTGDVGSYGAGHYDIFLLKFDSSGNLSWSETIGGVNADTGNSVYQTSDGGYIVTGSTDSYGAGNSDLFLLKFDSLGSLSWAETIGGASHDIGSSVYQATDGGYVVSGRTYSYGAGNSDLFLLKFDSLGSLSWAETIGGANYDKGFSVFQTADDKYIVTGETNTYGAGDYDVFLLEFNSSGNLSWAKTIGGADYDNGTYAYQTSDGGYIVTGNTYNYGAGNSDAFLLKFDSSGNLSWAKATGGANDDYSYSVSQTADDKYIITGETYDSEWNFSVITFSKFDSTGNIPGDTSIVTANPTVSVIEPTIASVSPTVSSQTPTVSMQELTAVDFVPTITTLFSYDSSSVITTPSGGGGFPVGYNDPPLSGNDGFNIVINNDDISTDNREVNLKLEAGENVRYFAVSERKEDFYNVSYEVFRPEIFNKSFVLSEGDGIKRVYAQFRTEYNKFSDIIFDEIILNTNIPIQQKEQPTTEEQKETYIDPETVVLVDGDLVRATDSFDVYIIKLIGDKKFKRLILNPNIFNQYAHLKWENVKEIDREILNQYITSDLVVALEDTKIYKLYTNGDTGEKRWIKTLNDFLFFDYDWDAVYAINNYEKNSYATGVELTQ